MERAPGHVPVLREAVVRHLDPAARQVLVDCTVGLGGHAAALLHAAGQCEVRLIGMDVDPSNLRLARQRLADFGRRVRLFEANFSDVQDVLAQAGGMQADALLADLGVASSQLDDPRRGLSFRRSGPLDMRLGSAAERTAADIVNSWSEADLAELIATCGEDRHSRRIARAIVEARRNEYLDDTVRLAEIITHAVGSPSRRAAGGLHPATRTFQALRIAVNDELAHLEKLLASLDSVVAPLGTVAIISFHSLEDRRVKHAFADLARAGRWRVETKKPVTPTPQEAATNPRSRSARLRIASRVA